MNELTEQSCMTGIQMRSQKEYYKRDQGQERKCRRKSCRVERGQEF